ncbi:hypothetical protein [Pseudoroseicyclus aestuarii]|uniref:hypothetical protein n=1 Tax=Pseudoroseicyclus aestuarii TaxID=1795041 RepID=UPI0011B6A573|nr:hypothetical protein [Pseudoroseicyclus aestuarii]
MADGHNEEIVNIGQSNTSLTFHDLQSIYNELTGRKEQLRDCIGPGYRISFEDLIQLNFKIEQCLASYGAKIGNCAVTVVYVNGQREVFSSFSRFKLFNVGNPSATLNLTLEYNFILIPAGSNQTLQYKLEVDLPSPVGAFRKAKTTDYGNYSLGLMAQNLHGHSKITYVDYAAARHFQAQVSEWVDSLTIVEKPAWLKFLQRHSHHFHFLTISICSAALLVSVLYYIAAQPVLLSTSEPTAHHMQTYNELLYSALLGLVMATSLGYVCGKALEVYVDRVRPMSYLLLNKGDENLIAEQKVSQRKAKLVFIAWIALTGLSAIALNLIASALFRFWVG